MKDVTAILVHYTDLGVLQKALNSLKKIKSRLKSIIVILEQGMSIDMIHGYDWFDQIEFLDSGVNGPGQILNDTIYCLSSPYVLFLQSTDYLSPTINTDSLQLSHKKIVLVTLHHNRNSVIHFPLLVCTSFLKRKKFLSNHQLPFKEALFPAWLSNVGDSRQLIKDNLVRQARKNSFTNTIEKEKFIQKYQLQKVKKEYPTVSVMISHFNMGKYVETAIVSCLLQSEQFEQVLIIDDGSTDNSFSQLQQWDDGKQVKVFKKKNGGKARALNELLLHVKSDFILELDADDWLDPDAVSIIKNYLAYLPKDFSVLYGNLRKWKQLDGDVLFKGVAKGIPINGVTQLLTYRFPLGPRVYRTSTLKEEGGFPVIEFENGRLYEDVSVLFRLIKTSQFRYHDFTVYNVREHMESITKYNDSKWNDFIKTFNSN
ncbi:glycosyltransferase [Ornithinibacillus sp. L9]|uniref:Glycosyltransferase n=1 Tax=Ornithinibacillus caprae TaxID=2678566 RepID=A0A6N8FFH8_9BACI|nr:glycosyltransferase family 2 protein [Ornithinibacillus caprae]MUK87456.1 glycosyltransferase [Ornithinibacillus caprae]